LQGNAYAYIHRNSKGTILSLDILPSERIQVIRNEQGTVLYVYSGDKNDKKVFQSSEIFHLKGFGPNGLMGLSVLSYARSSMQLGLNAEEYGKDFFGKGAKPSGVLMVDRVLSPEQRLAIKNNFEDLANNPDAARLWVLEANMKYEQISINPDDAQFISSRAFQTSDIARFFRVPSFLINDSTQNTTWGSGLEQTNLSFLQYTLRPYLMRWEQVIRKCLLDNQPDTKGQNIICEVNVEGLLRADSAGRASFYSTMVQNGLFSRNEVRAKENLPPVEGGDLLTAQLNLAPISELANWHEKTDTKIQGDPNAAKVD
jgi:HK97 family phage portal protein